MEFVRIIDRYDHLWAVKSQDKEDDELTDLFNRWNNIDYLLDFFTRNMDDLKDYFHIERLSQAIDDTLDDAQELETLVMDFPYTAQLDNLFKPLGMADLQVTELTREKARNWDRAHHASWLRIYAIRLDSNIYVVTGGAIKLTRTMQEREHTAKELEKLNRCRDYLKRNNVFDQDSFVELMNEEY